MTNPKAAPRLARWLIYAAIVTGSLALLLGIQRPYSSVVLLALLVGTGVFALEHAGYPPQRIAAETTRRIGGALWRWLIQPALLTGRALVHFYQHEPAQPTPPPGRLHLPPVVAWTLSLALTCAALLALPVAAASPAVGLALALLAAAVAGIGRALHVDALLLPRCAGHFIAGALAERTAPRAVPRRQMALELLLVLAAVLAATWRFHQADARLQLSGGETEWITNSVYAAHNGLRDYGRIPLWQPYLEFGEPLIDNPVGFVLNPFGSGLSLLMGAAQGLKYTVVLLALLAGVGGWFMGWALGLAWPGRVLLALLLVGKGNFHAMMNTGYFQLAHQQAYFPWLVGALVATARLPRARWPVVLLALAFTLLFFAGNLWYTLPMLIVLAALAAVYALTLKPAASASGRATLKSRLNFFKRLDGGFLRRLALAGGLTVGLSAVLLLPLAVNWERLGSHPPEARAGWEVDLFRFIVPLYVNSDPRQPLEVYDPKHNLGRVFFMDSLEEFYYSFVLPPWFAVLIIAGLPLYRPRGAAARRFALAAWPLLVLFTLWGAGGQPLFVGLYERLEFLQGWRFVGRALAVGSFLLAALVAQRVDALWHSLRETDWRALFPAGSRLARGLPVTLAAALVAASGLAGWEVVSHWNIGYQDVLNPLHRDDECVSWLRQQRPDDELAVWRLGYRAITTYMNNRARATQVYADFEMTPRPSTLGKVDLTTSLPEYGIAWTEGEQSYLRSRGYTLLPDSPIVAMSGKPCLYRKADALPYAYTVPLSAVLMAQPGSEWPDEMLLLAGDTPLPPDAITLPPEKTTPITTFIRQPDAIRLLARGYLQQFTVVTVQERAYPGWQATINGQPATVESVGGQIGVVLPRDGGQYVVDFVYRPPLLFQGAAVTLLAAAFSVVYLLRVGERVRRRRQRRL